MSDTNQVLFQYHDDGEKELGPTVGTLSLGSPSIMKFRPKRRAESFRGLPRHGETESDRALFKSVLEVPLRHGDLVVMHGTAIHRLYEVSFPITASYSPACLPRYSD